MGEMSGLWEGIVLSLLFVTLLTAVLGHFNTQYGESYSVGIDDTGITQFQTATSSAHGEIDGEITQTSEGLTLASSWNMGKGIFSTIWSFISGSWITSLMVILGMTGTAGTAIAITLRVLFLGMLIFGLIKLFFKVSP